MFKQAPWHHYGLLALEQTQLALRSPYLDNEFVRTVYRAPAVALANDDLCRRLIAEGDDAMSRIGTDRRTGSDRGPLAAAAARYRHEFSYKAEYAYDYGMPDWLAKSDQRLSGLHLERLFLGRHKFSHFRSWYKGPLSRYIRDVLLDPSALSRPYRTEGGRGRRERPSQRRSELHGSNQQPLTLELIHRLFLDGTAVSATA